MLRRPPISTRTDTPFPDTTLFGAGWSSVGVGNPLEGALVGPLIDEAAYGAMEAALKDARVEGGTVQGGERLLADTLPGAWYARPALAEMPGQTPVTMRETIAPLLYVMRYRALDEAISLPNAVQQGLASSQIGRAHV